LLAEMRGGLTATAAGRRYDATRSSVYRAAERLGLDARLGKRPDLGELRREVEDMPATKAVAFLLDLVEIAFPECDAAELVPLTGAGFTLAQSRILAILCDRPGRAMTHEAIAARAAVGADAISPEVLKVHVCRIRKRLRALGWPVELVTVWGFGFRLDILQEGWSWAAV